jgi:uncharacterized membrane protein HdeD (DUF308 family)
MIEGFTLGILATASLVVALFFLRFWKRTGDFLFLAFAVAFAADAVTRTIMAVRHIPSTGYSWVYVERLFEYVLILIGILSKNRRTQ